MVAARTRQVPTLPVAGRESKVAAWAKAVAKAVAKARAVVKGKVAAVKAAAVDDDNHQRLDNKFERRYGSCQDLTEQDPRDWDR